MILESCLVKNWPHISLCLFKNCPWFYRKNKTLCHSLYTEASQESLHDALLYLEHSAISWFTELLICVGSGGSSSWYKKIYSVSYISAETDVQRFPRNAVVLSEWLLDDTCVSESDRYRLNVLLTQNKLTGCAKAFAEQQHLISPNDMCLLIST